MSVEHDIVCPHCGHSWDYNGDALDDGEVFDCECEECGGAFDVEHTVSVEYHFNVRRS